MQSLNRRNEFKNILLRIITGCIFLFSGSVYAAGGGFLVSAQSAKIGSLSHQQIRRLFLGLPAEAGSVVKRPVINMSDNDCYQRFLKNIMFLTENGYKKKLVKRIFRQGADKIQNYKSMPALAAHLQQNPGDISFVCLKSEKDAAGFKVVNVLWQD